MKRHHHLSVLSSVIVLSSVAHGSIQGGEGAALGGRLRGNTGAVGRLGSDAILTRHLSEDEDGEDENNDDEENYDNANDDDAEEANNDDAAQYYDNDWYDYNSGQYYEGGDDENQHDDAWYEVEAGYTDDLYDANQTSTMDAIRSKVSNYASNAGSTAWEFYDSPPSQWTTSQWDVVFGILFTGLMVCILSCAGCAYCCFRGNDDEEGDEEKFPLSPKKGGKKKKGGAWSPRAPTKSPLAPFASAAARARKKKSARASTHRHHFDENHYRRYQEDDEQDDDEEQSQAEDEITVNTEADQSCYDPPAALAHTSSLADYTSVQREKEARILEAYKEDQLAKHNAAKASSNNKNDETADNSQEYDIDRVYTEADATEEEEDWKDVAYINSSTDPTKKSSRELDEALGGCVGVQNNEEGGDKLLEARDWQHNRVGYYL